MPSPIEHSKLSRARTGHGFIELHEWMDEEYREKDTEPRRHEVINIPENIKIVREKFGEGAVKEFLHHIKEDYERNKVYKLAKALGSIKRKIMH